MNIVLFTDAYPPFINGVSTSVFNLANVLRNHGHKVLVVGPKYGEGKTVFTDDGIFLAGIELKKLYGYKITPLFNSKVYKYIKAFKPDIIHMQTDFSIGQFARLVARRIKTAAVVYTYHTSYEDYTYYVTKTRGMADRIAKKFVRAYSKGLAKNVTEYITPSIKTMDYMRQIGIDSYINIVPTGIDFDAFTKNVPSIEQINKFKEENNIPLNTKIFLLLGRLAKEKSMDISIRGYHKFRQKYPNIPTKLIVVGEGPERSGLQNLTYELNESQNILFLGAKPAEQVPFYYHLADVYTSASTTETQGLTFMEAMASGTIVLARFDSQLADTIIDGETGFFFHDENTFVERAKTILDLTNDQKQNIIDNAYKIIDQYSIERFYNNIIKVYERAVRKKW